MDLCNAKAITLLQVTTVDDVTLFIVQLEVYPRACRAIYRALGRKVGQYADHADTRDQPREYNRWANPERSRSHQNS